MLGPLVTEPVGTGERAVTTADDEGVDAVADEVERSRAAALDLAEGGAAGSADERAADCGKAADVVPADLWAHSTSGDRADQGGD